MSSWLISVLYGYRLLQPSLPVLAEFRNVCNFFDMKVSRVSRVSRVSTAVSNIVSLFQPSLASKKSCGLSQLIYYSVLKCDEKIRSELLSNITLSGGNTKFPGFEKRLYQELSGLFDEKTNIKVKALPNRELLGWVGGARLVLQSDNVYLVFTLRYTRSN